MPTGDEAIALTITTTFGSRTVNLRIEQAREVLSTSVLYIRRNGQVIKIEDLGASEIAHHLAALWMNRAMGTSDEPLIYSQGPDSAIAIRPQAILAITGEVITPGKGIGFGVVLNFSRCFGPLVILEGSKRRRSTVRGRAAPCRRQSHRVRDLRGRDQEAPSPVGTRRLWERRPRRTPKRRDALARLHLGPEGHRQAGHHR